MKDLDPLKQLESQVRQEQQLPQQKEYRLATTIRVKRGCKLWSFDVATNKIDEVVPEKEVMISMEMKEVHLNKAKHEKTSILYVQAINRTNAARKITKALLELKEKGKLSKSTQKKIHYI